MEMVEIPHHKNQNDIQAVIFDSSQKERLIRKPEVLSRTGLSSSSLYQKISEGKCPGPIHPYGPRVSIWRESDIDNFITDLLKAAGKEVIS